MDCVSRSGLVLGVAADDSAGRSIRDRGRTVRSVLPGRVHQNTDLGTAAD